MPDRVTDIHDCQEWVRTAPLKEVMEFHWWSQGIIDMRGHMEAQPKRKTRSDAGKPRDDGQQPIDLKEIVK